MCRTERIESHLVSQNGRRLSCSFIGCCQPIRTQVPNHPGGRPNSSICGHLKFPHP